MPAIITLLGILISSSVAFYFILTRNAFYKHKISSFGSITGIASMRGRRSTMEDDHFSGEFKHGEQSIFVAGVLDGHGGISTAKFVSGRFVQEFKKELSNCNSIKEALSSTFHNLDERFLEIARKRKLRDGTTLLVSVVAEKTLYIANTGDSRAVLVKKGGASEPLSNDHKAGKFDEFKRISSLGGRVSYSFGTWRIEGKLAVSRALGDIEFKKYAICDPEIKSIDLKKGFRVIKRGLVFDSRH
ncbi:hypothetical protein MHBO_002273 [Bonamia ostreae]|uniref:protein-serine/threonine phosphatase n=1 Tax=Bonamia ostreae TaxID=126728 RepID=A0ABV2AM87_9EUKA